MEVADRLSRDAEDRERVSVRHDVYTTWWRQYAGFFVPLATLLDNVRRQSNSQP